MPKKNLLSITEIEDRAKIIVENLKRETFIADFLGLFDIPKTSITRAKSSDGDFVIRNKVCYRKVDNNPLRAIDEITQEFESQNKKPRYLITTDFEMLYAKDTKTNDSLAINFEDLPTSAEFFLAWNGIEKVDYQKENPADIKAAERFTKLYDELVKINPELAKEEVDGKSFNLFLIRSLFLYFSEDTEIITKGSFTNILKTRTEADGSNLNSVIKELFSILDVPENERHETPEWLKEFPYVNGQLFKEPHHDLNFNVFTRKLLIEAGELLNWNEINPDILGAMIQTVANKEERQVSGMHYTSVPNIMKVIKPLFLDDIQTEYQRLADRSDDYLERDITEEQRRKQQRDIINQLENLIKRMSKIKFLDPACGSGNFLIITYKELRRLEINCLVKIREVRESLNEKDVYQGNLLKQSRIKLDQFSGIELDDFAHEVAKLSLYIAEHQMNVEMTASLADYQPRILPLQESGNIVHANALQVDWNQVVPHGTNDEVYIMGNPPYVGARKQKQNQNLDLTNVFHKYQINTGDLDYISGWFIKGAEFVQNSLSQLSFVSTNSITQGSQVSLLWPSILNKTNASISFAYPSFKWANSAKNNAGVTVVIIGLSDKKNTIQKRIFIGETWTLAKNITPYLTEGENIIVSNAEQSISGFPEIASGDMPNDGGNFIVEKDEYYSLVNQVPGIEKYLKKFIGSKEFVASTYRYIFHLTEQNHNEAEKISEIAKRVEAVRKHRLSSDRNATKKLATISYRYGEYRHKESNFIFVPQVSSEFRDYVPMGYFEGTEIVASPNFTIYDAPIWLLGILESRMHMNWLRAIGGKLETRYRYSAGMVYNTFPIPNITTQRKNILEEAVFEMLDVREEEGGTLAELYGGANKPMNARLREAHEKIDGIVERAYKQEPFKSDEERLSVLLKLYQEMVSEGIK
ncbi:DNA methyltransferase [Trichococcus ilyis]|uniref:site-specific DNA-methyltransferase (adenine-specific) n=1 Tax=Trichococcus ilyis TaxID=640938 RepID=A0A143YDY3_9LACT|nr:DNA methyltransferase [Trichococcus ilyis]CZQ86544.1 s-adenosyl-l-methionine-dependent methyltransferase [Trichococcus ilyis]SEI61478.1 Type II restriction/modification system, DNA methylase subunit YeeA [Trichococcus ilyis]